MSVSTLTEAIEVGLEEALLAYDAGARPYACEVCGLLLGIEDFLVNDRSQRACCEPCALTLPKKLVRADASEKARARRCCVSERSLRGGGASGTRAGGDSGHDRGSDGGAAEFRGEKGRVASWLSLLREFAFS
jgi:hypothetical protein